MRTIRFSQIDGDKIQKQIAREHAIRDWLKANEGQVIADSFTTPELEVLVILLAEAAAYQKGEASDCPIMDNLTEKDGYSETLDIYPQRIINSCLPLFGAIVSRLDYREFADSLPTI